MPEIPVGLNKNEVSWVTWYYICAKFNFSPHTTKDIVLYVVRAHTEGDGGNTVSN